jgi:hypothetical protein
MQYDNTNKIVIFKKENKTNEKQPDYTGTLNVEGKEYSVSLWIKEGKSGKFLGGQIQEPYKKMENTSDKIKKDNIDLPF